MLGHEKPIACRTRDDPQTPYTNKGLGFRVKGLGLGCSPLYKQSLIGIIIGGTIVPIKGEHPK